MGVRMRMGSVIVSAAGFGLAGLVLPFTFGFWIRRVLFLHSCTPCELACDKSPSPSWDIARALLSHGAVAKGTVEAINGFVEHTCGFLRIVY